MWGIYVVDIVAYFATESLDDVIGSHHPKGSLTITLTLFFLKKARKI